ncbi:sigma-70 family RNA polymerase sigma factor [Terrimonas sp. NA20]|uniref:RNA polymerase sigma factor n=1 Tax=Terrimonas ginsenosidimutans TaxID=2908004 RepID=A0ABS9KW32_9BACT|nr:sigma-70 family RNA polymerase sigma factor [Terrimonas ginsenosidimutans]MCG2616472.1 sigma-70 family RNA polymerase sigma factor [Terrimonas ginsenosidimutans]
MNTQHDISRLIDHLFRHESGKMIAVLSRLLGLQNLSAAEDIVQDTLLQAMNSWSYGKIPDQPAAWLHRVARNKAIDLLRREKRFRQISPEYAKLLESEWTLAPTVQQLFLDNEIKDSQLQMIFAACHPSIPAESRIPFTLKTLCGLSAAEISRAFLCAEETISKRIYRAKEKIRSEAIGLDIPEGNDIAERVDVVLKTLYLLFNEGYNSSHPDLLIRTDLCEEAIRLCDILAKHPLTNFPRTHALLSLFYFQSSRLSCRLDSNGAIVLLTNQDRTRWDRSLIQKGFEQLEMAAEPFEVSPYHLEAGIASLHAAAPSFERTDWKSIYHLYQILYQLQPNPFVALNKAIASAYAISHENALDELNRIEGLEKHHLYFATIGEIFFEMQQKQKARESFQKALHLTSSAAEQKLLEDKISRC